MARVLLSRMVQNARKHTKKNPLPPPQDIKFWLQKGQSMRFSFTRFPTDLTTNLPDLNKSPLFSSARRHYVPPEFMPKGGLGSYILCRKGKEYCDWCHHSDEKVRFSRIAIATTIVVWPTLASGALDLSAIQQGEFDVTVWIFNKSVYKELRVLDTEWGLNSHDLVATCDLQQYQRMTFLVKRESHFKNLLRQSRDLDYWLDRGFEEEHAKLEMSKSMGLSSIIISDTNKFIKKVPNIMGL